MSLTWSPGEILSRKSSDSLISSMISDVSMMVDISHFLDYNTLFSAFLQVVYDTGSCHNQFEELSE
jgi:hypothetical protein